MPEIAIYYDEDKVGGVRGDLFSWGDLQIIASKLKILCRITRYHEIKNDINRTYLG